MCSRRRSRLDNGRSSPSRALWLRGRRSFCSTSLRRGLTTPRLIELAALIRRLADEWGIGVLLVEHKVDLVMSISDRITVLDAGRTVITGPPEVVEVHPEVLEAYLGVGV